MKINKTLAWAATAAAIVIGMNFSALAQSGESRSDVNSMVVAQGTKAKLALETRVNTKMAEVGDEVIGLLDEDVRSEQGDIAIERGTVFIGRVTQTQAARRPLRQATLRIVFHTMMMPYGAEKISVVVMAIDDYSSDRKYNSKEEEGKVGGGNDGQEVMENLALGAGIGALGGSLGGSRGAGVGLGIGAINGVLLNPGNNLNLDRETILRVRFERSVALPAVSYSR